MVYPLALLVVTFMATALRSEGVSPGAPASVTAPLIVKIRAAVTFTVTLTGPVSARAGAAAVPVTAVAPTVSTASAASRHGELHPNIGHPVPFRDRRAIASRNVAIRVVGRRSKSAISPAAHGSLLR
jgi:hypothetical protein